VIANEELNYGRAEGSTWILHLILFSFVSFIVLNPFPFPL